jgi:hypothetical protein
MERDNKIFEPAVVLDSEDPMMLNRIRARILTYDYDSIIRSISDPPFNEEKDKWGDRDPFVFQCLLPYYITAIPKRDELVQVIFFNKEYKFDNQYYIQPNLTSPMLAPFDYYVQAQKYTGTGKRYQSGVPIKNIDGTHREPSKTFGVFPEPGDNALMGRGSSDVVIKENDVIIRSGKIKGNFSKNKLPVANKNRAFVQLSLFNGSTEDLPKETILDIKENILNTKYLIEWNITNPENTQDIFHGSVYLYELKQNSKVASNVINVSSDLEDIKKIRLKLDFNNLTLNNAILFINNFILDCNNKNKLSTGEVLFDSDDKFPIFFRPSPMIYDIMTSTENININARANLIKVYNSIKLFPSNNGGYGLIYEINKIGSPISIKKSEVRRKTFNSQPKTYAAIGSDDIYLLSHKSSIPQKGSINLENTIYGIDSDKFEGEIKNKTSSMVRGEELLELINLIIRFLISHTHAYPGLPPVPVTEDGMTTEKLIQEFSNAVNKILNKNIRIN